MKQGRTDFSFIHNDDTGTDHKIKQLNEILQQLYPNCAVEIKIIEKKCKDAIPVED